MNRLRWLSAIVLSLAALSPAHAQDTGPTVPNTQPAPLDTEQQQLEQDRATRPSMPPSDAQSPQRDDQNRPRSERLPPEVNPGSQPGNPGSSRTGAALERPAS